MTVAGSATALDVVATAPLAQDTKTDLSQVVDTRQIQDLPINGRRVDTFVLLTPGVTNDGNFGLLSLSGVANGNAFLLDSNDSTEEFFVENNGRTRIIPQISQDAVQEFQVVTANFCAEYGKANGGGRQDGYSECIQSGSRHRLLVLVNSVYQPALYRSDARISKIIPVNERYRLYLNFEVFNISNSWSPTSMTTQAYLESKGVLTLTPTAYGFGTTDAMNPDGTQARRIQVSARFVF